MYRPHRVSGQTADSSRPDEFTAAHQLAFVPVHTLPTCSLIELTHHLAAAQGPSILPSPSIGTRIAFRLVYVDTRGASGGAGNGSGRLEGIEGASGAPRFIVKDLGSAVIGGGGPGAPTTSLDAIDDYVIEEELVDSKARAHEQQQLREQPQGGDAEDGHKTLADVRYVVGDFISCAILPPLANGCVAPASDARSGRGSGIGEAPASRMPPPAGGATYSRYSDFRVGKRGRIGPGGPSNFGVPTGDWRRGDAIPDGGAWLRDGGRGSGGGGGAGRGGWGRRRGGRGDRW